jgi:predicted SnoaL-like aldol condensation-catalyzing enzyme
MRALAVGLIFGAFFVAGSGGAQLPEDPHPNPRALLESADAELAANKRLVTDFWRVVVQARQVERAAEYLGENYVEHEPGLPSGRAAAVERHGRQPPETVADTVEDLVSIVAERDLVVLAFRRELFDLANEGQTYTTTWFEMFRVADGRIVERWNFGPKE